MPIIKPKGLQGLKGLGEISKAQYDNFINSNRDLIAQHGYDPMYINNLYSNKQFIDKYGVERFKSMPDIDMRNELYKSDIVNAEFDKLYKPTRTNKGLGMDYNKYNQLSADAKLKLLESDYLTPTEFENKWQKHLKEIDTRANVQSNSGAGAFMPLGASLSSPIAASRTGKGSVDVLRMLSGEEAGKKLAFDKNQKILDKIYNDDVDSVASKFGTQVSQAYNDPLISNMSDSQVKEAFVQAITPGSYKDKNGMPNMGIAEFASHYGNGTENEITSEMRNFSIDDMRQVLAKKKVYDAYMSPEMAATALNNDAKRYIKEHQGSFKKLGLFLNDVGISAMSYTADKLNGITELGRMAQDALGEKPMVMVDDRGNILDPNIINVVRDRQGGLHYKGSDGQLHSIHQEQIDYTTLHNMGKNPDGSDIKGAFGMDWLTLNPQYWTRAEQFGTLDENEQKQYEKLGSSPYKITYNPNEDSDLWYEAFKMMSFGIADAASQLVPYGIGMAGKALSTANNVGKIARGFGKALDTTGKLLTAETKVGQVAQGTAGALGIAYAYNRGAFQETLQQNLANAEEAVTNASKTDIFNQYNTDKDYKAQVDRLINARASSLKANYIAQMRRDGGMQIADEKALDKMLHAKAQDAVLGELVQNRIKERMSSKEYANLQQEAINSAGDAAFNTFWPEAIKYGFVNTMGYRKYLYTNPAGLTQKVSSSLKGLKEITTLAGKKRMATEASKFLTRADKWKELGKTLGSQAWGGAWTNGTDDMQVDAAERINEDSFNRYLNAYQNGEALADVYGFADGIFSYMKGLSNSMGQETTWNSATVGGLGSIVNFTPNFANIARLATKEGREAYRNNFRREVERDENGIPLRNEDGSVKYKELGKFNDWRGQLNYFIQNGVLNTYYGKKQSERDLQNHADYVNNILDSYNDFADIEQLVASNIAAENVESLGDQKTISFIKALHAINALNALGKDSSDPTTMSSVVQNAKKLIDRASQLNLEEGNNPFSEEEISNLLSQYYASNPDLEQSESNNLKALYDIAQNAQKLQEASNAMDKAEKEIQKIEKNIKSSIDPLVRTRMKEQQALDAHWRERKEKMQSEIDDASSDDISQDSSTVIASVGGKRNAQSLIKIYDKQQTELEKELGEQKAKTSELSDKATKAKDILDKARDNGDSNAVLQAENAVKKANAELQSSKEQESYLNSMIASTIEKRTSLQTSLDSVNDEAKATDKILTADEIFSLDPVTRAKMMRLERRELYSKEQQREIEKLEQRLLMRDADALQKIQDIALLTQRIASNQDAYSRMAKNPEAAAVELENQRALASNTAYRLINQRNAETFADYINQFDESMKEHQDITEEDKNNFVFKQLRKLNPNLLDIIDENALLPQYQTQIKDAKEWGKTVEDIDAIINEADRDDAWKENAIRNIDTLVENSNNKEEIMRTLEKVIDDLGNSDAAKDVEYILNGMSDIGYQRDSTILEDRKLRKERESEEKKKKQEAKEKAEKDAKAAGEKQVMEEPKNVPTNDNFKSESELEDVDLEVTGETSEEPTTAKSQSEDSQTADNNTNTTETVETDKGNEDKNTLEIKYDSPIAIAPNEYESFTDTAKHEKNASFEAHSAVKKNGDWYFIGNFAGSKETTQVKSKKNIDTNPAVKEQQGKNKEGLAVQGTNPNDVGLEETDAGIQGKPSTLEEQLEEANNAKEIHISDANEDAATVNGIGQSNIDTNATTLSGNAMSEYVPDVLENDGILERKKGSKQNDKMNQYYAWMNSAGIKLQSIIDNELARIIKRNPHAKVKFMAVKPANNATNDAAMQQHLMLVLDYDNNINKGIVSIHDDSNGGVIESNGKKYLIIGVAGYGNMNQSKLALYDWIWNPNKKDGYNLKAKRKQYFDSHPTERFYVNEELSTEIVPKSQIPGYIVRQMENDEYPEFRSVRELLVDESRNPQHYDLQSVAWGIQQMNKFLIIGTSLDNVMVPRNPMGNMGSAFVLMPASNGKMVPSYLKVLKYTEMRDGALKDRINNLLQEVVGTDYNGRYQALAQLNKIFYLNKNEEDISISKSNKNEISLMHNGKVLKTFVLDSNFDRSEFMKAMDELNPRINITASVLSTKDLLDEYDEAGAFMTDAALFGTAGSSYSIYGLDSNGNMIMPETPVNESTKSRNNSDFKNDKSQVIYNHQYYREDKGVFSLDGKVITDEKLLSQLRYNKMILDNELSPAVSEKTFDYYILNAGENPEVIKVNQNTKEVTVATEDQAKKLIERVNKKRLEELREEAAQKAVKAEETQEASNKEEIVEFDNGGLVIDSQTGEIIQAGNQESSSVKESPSKEEERDSKEKTSSENKLHEESTETLGNADNVLQTQKFTDLLKNKKYKIRLRKVIKQKWNDAPSKSSELEKFLRSKNVEVDNIGTSEADIEAWMRTMEDCR